MIGERGRPETCRFGQRSGVHLAAMLAWAEDWKVRLVHIQPGRPMQNGHVESFHGATGDECLNASWFRTLNDVRCTLAVWREEYNCERPPWLAGLPYAHGVQTSPRRERALARLPSLAINTTENLQL